MAKGPDARSDTEVHEKAPPAVRGRSAHGAFSTTVVANRESRPNLKRHFQGQLKVPRRKSGQDAAEIRVRQRTHRRSQIGMVDEVKCLEAEFGAKLFSHRDVLDQSEIPAKDARRPHRIPPAITKSARRVLDVGGGIEPALNPVRAGGARRLRRNLIRQIVDAGVRGGARQRVVPSALHRKRKAATYAENTADLPMIENAAGDASERPDLRQVIQQRNICDVRDIEVTPAVIFVRIEFVDYRHAPEGGGVIIEALGEDVVAEHIEAACSALGDAYL